MSLKNVKRKLTQKQVPDSPYTRKTITVGPDGKRVITSEPISYHEFLEDLSDDETEEEDYEDW